MNLKTIRNLIIFLIVLTLIILISLFVMQKENKNTTINDYAEDDGYVAEKVLATLQDINVYMKIKNHLSTLLLYKNAGNTNAIEEITGSSNIFSDLNVDIDNPIMLDIVYRTGDTMNSINFVKFNFYKQNQNYYAVVILDVENGTYRILESNNIEYQNAKNNEVDSKYNKKITIPETKYNKIKEQPQLSEEETIKEYFRDYIQKALYYPEEAYSKQNEEYSKKRFGSYDKFQEYLQENKSKLESLDIYSIKSAEDFETDEEYEYYMSTLTIKGLNKYQVKKYDNYIEYTCIDDYGDYYIFKVKGAMEYEVYLDNYTVDLPSFVERYNLLTEEEKVALNVNKFLKAIENKDYSYAYSKLSEDFINNYIKTEEIFIAYVSSGNWLKYDDIASADVELKNSVYVCTVKTKEGKQKQFIMKLEEGTDFVMSFGI